jgi:glycosyltransferase involved in cell wall biosynthesis
VKALIVSTQIYQVPPVSYGGLEVCVFNLAEALGQMGHDIFVLCPEGSKGQHFTVCSAGPAGLHNPEEQAYNALKPSFKDFDVIHDHSWAGFPYLAKREWPKLKLLHTIHSQRPYNTKPVDKPCFVAASQAQADYLKREVGFDCKVVHHGIDLSLYPLCTAKEDFLLYLARVQDEKGALEFVQLCKSVGMKGMLAGEDIFVPDPLGYPRRVMEACEQSGGLVRYLGRVPFDYKLELLQTARCLVAPLKPPYCLPPGEIVLTNPSAKPIEDVRPADRVFGADGVWHLVTGINKRQFDGELVVLYPHLSQAVRLTPEHRVLAVRPRACGNNANSPCRPNSCRCLLRAKRATTYKTAMEMDRQGIAPSIIRRQLEVPETTLYYWRKKRTRPQAWDKPFYQSYNPEWIAAKDLRAGDFLAVPTPKETVEYAGPPPRLLGYYVAEGFTNNDNLRLAFGTHETALINDARHQIEQWKGKAPAVYPTKTATLVVWYSTADVSTFREWCGVGAHNKKVPLPILQGSQEVMQDFLKGLWAGDGCVSHRNGYQVLCYATVSPTLARQLLLLLARVGVIAKLGIVSSPRAFNKGKPVYQLTVSGQHMIMLSSLLDYPINEKIKRSRAHASSFIHEGFLYYPIRHIARQAYKGPVHDLQVESAESFLAGNIMVHNCEIFGLSTVEALSCGTPVLSTDRGAARELLVHGTTGAIAEDVACLETNLEIALQCQPKACRRRAEEFSREKMATAYLDLYRRIIEDNEQW